MQNPGVTREMRVSWKVCMIYCPESLVLLHGFGVSLAFVVYSMNSTKDQRVSSPLTSELAVDERERRLQRRRERERARRDSETAEQREERLRKRRMRDRTRRAL